MGKLILLYTPKLLCWFGVHRGLYLEKQYMEDAVVLSILGVDTFTDCIHLIDRCPHCNLRWKSLLAPNGYRRDFTEPIKEDQ